MSKKRDKPIHAHLTVAERITLARKQAGFESQADFATVLGVSRGLVGQWESDVKLPGRGNLVHIAKHCGVSMEWLIGQSGDMSMDVAAESNDEALMLLAYRRLAPLGKRNLLELLTKGLRIRRSIQQEPEPT